MRRFKRCASKRREGKPRVVHVTIAPCPTDRAINIEAEVMAFEPDRLMIL